MRGLAWIVGIAAAGYLTVIAGLYLSFYLNIASGATIVLVLTSMFFLALVFAPIGSGLRRRLAHAAR